MTIVAQLPAGKLSAVDAAQLALGLKLRAYKFDRYKTKKKDDDEAKGVTVNTVSPGYIATDMVKSIRQDVLDKIIAGIPVKRLGTPDDIASMVSWVASDESGFATGADFSVNGGLHMG